MAKKYSKFSVLFLCAWQLGGIGLTSPSAFASIGTTEKPALSELTQLPADAPQSIRDQLARAHDNDTDAMHAIALHLMAQRNSDDDNMARFAFGWALYAGRNGHPEASELTGSLYRQGIGVPQNFAKARRWLERALARKSKEANFELALLYADQANPNQNKAKAADYLAMAIRRSEPRACLIAARGKLEDGVEFRKVIDDVTCAAEGGLTEAMEMLGDFNLNLKSPYARVRARHWFGRAAELGSPSAATKLLALDEE